MDFNKTLEKLQEASKKVTLKKEFKGIPKGAVGYIKSDYNGQGRLEVGFSKDPKHPIEGKIYNNLIIFRGDDIEEYLQMEAFAQFNMALKPSQSSKEPQKSNKTKETPKRPTKSGDDMSENDLENYRYAGWQWNKSEKEWKWVGKK